MSISCTDQECHRLILLLEAASKDPASVDENVYVLTETEIFFVEEYFHEVEKYFNNHNISLNKKYKKTEKGRVSIYMIKYC